MPLHILDCQSQTLSLPPCIYIFKGKHDTLLSHATQIRTTPAKHVFVSDSPIFPPPDVSPSSFTLHTSIRQQHGHRRRPSQSRQRPDRCNAALQYSVNALLPSSGSAQIPMHLLYLDPALRHGKEVANLVNLHYLLHYRTSIHTISGVPDELRSMAGTWTAWTMDYH